MKKHNILIALLLTTPEGTSFDVDVIEHNKQYFVLINNEEYIEISEDDVLLISDYNGNVMNYISDQYINTINYTYHITQN